jgi:hypothetical protein
MGIYLHGKKWLVAKAAFPARIMKCPAEFSMLKPSPSPELRGISSQTLEQHNIQQHGKVIKKIRQNRHH